MLAGVGVEINEQPERYNDTLWRSYALFPLFCHICFRHCARRNGGYPLSPVFIFNRLGIRCNDLARYPWRMPRGVWSWCCAPQGERNKTAGSPWRLRCFPCCYCGGSRMGRLGLLCSRRFYSNRVCTNLVVASCFVCLVLHWVVAPLICNLGYGGLSFDTGGGAGRRKGDPPIAEHAFCRNNSCPVLPAVLLSNFMESRSRAMGDALCNGRINWPRAFNSAGLSRIGCGPAALLSPRLWSGAGRRVCPFCACSSSHWPCSGCRGGILCKRCRSHCITVDGVRYCCCRLRMHIAKGETGQQFGYPSHVRPIRCGGVSPALSPREEQFVRLLLKGKTPAEIARETGTKPSTVRTTLHRAYGKASVAGSRELVALFAGEGDATGPGLLQRHAGDMLTSVRTRRLFRYLLTTFFILLAAGPLVMADSDWGSGVSRAVAFSLASYALGLGLLLSLHYAGEKLNREVALTRTDGAIGLGSPCVWAVLSAVEWSFVYIAAWRCICDPLMAAPVLLCGVASTVSLAVGLRPFKVHARVRAIVPLVSIGAATLIHAATRGRIHGFAVLTGMLLTYIVLRSCPQRKMLGIWMLCFGAAAPVWVVLLNMVQDLTVFEPLFLASLLGQSSAVNVVVATVIVCWSVPMFVTHIVLVRSVEDEKAVLKYRANGSTEAAHVRRLALLTSRALSDVQAPNIVDDGRGHNDKDHCAGCRLRCIYGASAAIRVLSPVEDQEQSRAYFIVIAGR